MPPDAAAKQIIETITVKADNNDEAQELKSRFKDLEETTRMSYDSELESECRQVYP